MIRYPAAVMWADVVGYSRMMGMGRGRHAGTALGLSPRVVRAGGGKVRGLVVKLMGHGALVVFDTALQVVRCELGLQQPEGTSP